MLPRKKVHTFVVLLIAMLADSVVRGLVQLMLAGISGSEFTWALSWPGP